MSYTEEELAGLTDEEREALNEPDDTTTTMDQEFEGDQDGQKKSEDDADGADDGDEAGDAGKGGKQGADGDDAGDAGGNDDGADGKGDDAADAGAAAMENPKAAPLLLADAPADAEVKLGKIAEQKAALVTQCDDGDITVAEFQAQLDKLNKEERTIERAMDKAQLAAEMNQQQEVNTWMKQVTDFTSKAQPEYSTSKVRWMALDAFVKEIGQDPKNSSMTGAQILAEAHKRVVEDLGEVTAKPKTDAAKKPLKGSSAEAPKTLAKVPAAQSNDTDDGRWTSLDRLQSTDPEAHEEALMKLSPAERDTYLSR